MSEVHEHVVLYKEPGLFGGWPANGGIWSWNDEIVVGFNIGLMDYERMEGHPVKGWTLFPAQARSLDGGHSWEVDDHPHENPNEKPPTQCPGDVTFTQDDFAMKIQRTGEHAGHVSWFYTSYDRCRTWYGPYSFPMIGLPGIAARTDYQVLGPNECLVFLTAPKSDGYEGRALCARTTDGARTFQFTSWIGPESPREGWSIMPASLRLPSGRLLATLRRREKTHEFIDMYSSDDNAASWQIMAPPVPDSGGGNPPALVRYDDESAHPGRIVLTYANRKVREMRARYSDDEGTTWSDEILLRDGAGTGDIGYSRTCIRADGKIVTAYYWNDPVGEDGKITDRYIGVTIWET
jgi:hypothetical protein